MLRFRYVGLALFTCLIALTATATAKAVRVMALPVPQRAAAAEVVVVGKVTGIEDKNVAAARLYGDDKVEYQIAVVKVQDAVIGAKDQKEIRVGFVPRAPGGPIRPGLGAPIILTKDQEACFFLTKHPTENFYVVNSTNDYINNDVAEFAADVDLLHDAAKLLANADKGLKSDNAEERLRTAGLLVVHYRTMRISNAKTEPIAAERSKLILKALAEADWTPPAPGVVPERIWGITPFLVFNRLGVTPNDGFTPPNDFKDFGDAAKKWLKENGDKYRIERYTSERSDKK